jgi:transposase InsO family protein
MRGKFVEIGKYLSTLQWDESWSTEDFHRIGKKENKYFIKVAAVWRHTKKKNGTPMRVVRKLADQRKRMSEFHESAWAGYRGMWATFENLKEKYWWPGIYKDVAAYVETCKECQMFSNVRRRDEVHPTYLLAMHDKWMVDIVIMPMGGWQMKYLVLAREDLTNQVEGRALRTNETSSVCRFLLEDVICRYGYVDTIVDDRGELDANEAREFFSSMGIKLSLTMAYNPEANGKVERGHGPIMKALVKACHGKMREWPRLLPFALWADRTTHSSVTGYMPTELI